MNSDVKKEIGLRLATARKERLGITIKELAQRTKKLSAQRISNWEQGTRSPGPLEAKLLGQHLNISPAYLLCLTDNPLGETISHKQEGLLDLPLYPLSQLNPSMNSPENSKTLLVSNEQNPKLKKNCIALLIEDESMIPLFKPNDLIIIAPSVMPIPGNHVVCFYPQKKQVALRLYQEIEDALYKLSTYNPLWADINITHHDKCDLLGVVMEHRSYAQ